MTPAIVVKNIILFLLIVLIGHFLVKNFLIDKEDKNSPLLIVQSPETIVQKQKSSKDNTEPTIAKSEKEPEGLDKAKAELLKFVDEEETEHNLKPFFKDTSNVPTDDCKSKIQTSQFPLSTTCDPNIQIVDAYTDKRKDAKKPNICTTLTKNVLVLNEYDNENVMNGGELFNGLNAFDSFDNHFQMLT